MEIFRYGPTETEYLKRRDKRLGAAIDKIGIIERNITSDPFGALVMSIISQQISKKAAHTIWGRLCEELSEVTPRSVAKAHVSDIQKCGLSAHKSGYIKGIGDAVVCGKINFSHFVKMQDDEIVRELSSLDGIGVWTAEMFLIFALCRPDVVSWGDLGIRRGMMNLYGLKELTKDRFERYRKRYSPYGSVASLYLWALSIP